MAMRGTAIHAQCAEHVTTGKEPSDDVAGRCVGMFADLVARFPDLAWETEVKVDTGIADCYGTADLIGVGAYSPDAVLLDWKTGTGKRDNAADSRQIQAYAIGIIRQNRQVDRVTCIVGELEQEPTECVFTRQQLDECARKIACLIAMAETATPADYQPSARACQYCRHDGNCSAQGAAVATIASSIPAKTEAGIMAAVATMTPEAVADALDKYSDPADLVAMFKEAIEKRAKAMIESGKEVPGWKLKEKATARKWTVPDSRVMEICATYEVDPNDIASPAEIEKRLAKKRDKKEAAEILSAISAKGTSKSLVKDGKK
jgi:hypothetical protein